MDAKGQTDFGLALRRVLAGVGAFALVLAVVFALTTDEAAAILRALVLGVGSVGLALLEWRTRKLALVGHLLLGLVALATLTSVWVHGLATTMLPLLVMSSPLGTLTGGPRSGRVWLAISVAVLGVGVACTPTLGGVEISLAATALAATLCTAAITLAFRSVTESQAERLRATNVALRSEQKAAEAASTAKSTFLATMSHEIRTPLNAVIGLAEMLGERPLPAEDVARVRQIQRSGGLLLDLLNDVLDLSRVESGQLTLDQRPTDLNALCEAVVEALAPQAEGGRCQLRFEASRPLGWVHCDPIRLRQVLVNLVGNALKFTPEGEVVLRAEAHEEDGGLVQVVLEVADTGVGIPEEARDRVFEAFAQADEGRDRAYGGSGLGLAISARIAQLFGGRLTLVRSEEGVGSLFRLTFTANAASRQGDPEPVEPGQVAGLRVLIVEDDRINRLVVESQLRFLGCDSCTAQNGEEALERFDETVDLVLMDQQMPVMDGITAAKRLREMGVDVPIIALTANAFEEDRRRCLEAGMDDFLTKPIAREVLLRTLARHTRDRRSLSASAS